jgi:hypothetical protein
MKNVEKARYEADDRVNTFMLDHETELSAISLYATIRALFLTIFGNLKAAMKKQSEDITVFAASKSIIWITMAESVYKFAMRASVQAHLLGQYDLERALNKPLGHLLYCEDIDAMERAEVLKELMKNNLILLTELTAVDIGVMESKIEDFSKVRDKPEDQIRIRKAQGTTPIPILLNELDVPKDLLGRLVYSYLPDLKLEWDERSKVGEPEGVRHISLALHYSSAGSGIDLKGVNCTINNSIETIKKQSLKTGWVHFYSLSPRDYSITSEFEGYDTDVQPSIGIDDNHVVRLEIKLKQKVAEGDQETKTGILDLFIFSKVDGLPLAGAQYSVPALMIVDTTDEDGEGYEDLLDPGNYTGTIVMPGFKDLPFTFEIKAGETTTLQLMMEKMM